MAINSIGDNTILKPSKVNEIIDGVNTNETDIIGLQDNKADKSETIGIGQTWQDVTSSRAFSNAPGNNEYTNNTGKPIYLSVWVEASGSSVTLDLYIDTLLVNRVSNSNADPVNYYTLTTIIPNGASYRLYTDSQVTNTISTWAELR